MSSTSGFILHPTQTFHQKPRLGGPSLRTHQVSLDRVSVVCRTLQGAHFPTVSFGPKEGMCPHPHLLFSPMPASLLGSCLPPELPQTLCTTSHCWLGSIHGGHFSAKVLKVCAGLGVLAGKLLCFFPFFHPWSVSDTPFLGTSQLQASGASERVGCRVLPVKDPQREWRARRFSLRCVYGCG